MAGADPPTTWRDGDEDFDRDVLPAVARRGPFPARCPACSSPTLHVYFHRHDARHDRGGSWVWCSHCRRYSHASAKPPPGWRNLDLVDPQRLTHAPSYLETLAAAIDAHWAVATA